MQQNSRCPFSGSGSFSLLAVRSMVACRQPFFHYALPAVAFRCAPLVWVSGRWPACCAPSAERIFLPAAAAKLTWRSARHFTRFRGRACRCRAAATTVPSARCRPYPPTTGQNRGRSASLRISARTTANSIHRLAVGSLPGQAKRTAGQAFAWPRRFVFVLCRQPPRYAFLTSSLASSSSPVPDSTMLPFSST